MEKFLKLKMLDAQDEQAWDDFVLGHPLGTIFHQTAWLQVLKLSYGHCPFHLVLKRGAVIEGGIPFILIKSRLRGTRLVSLPFTTHCSALLPASEIAGIIMYAMEAHPDIGMVELKFLEPMEKPPRVLEQKSEFVTHILDLTPGPEQVFKSFHDTSIRQRVRRAEKSGLKFRLAEEEGEIAEFYRLYTEVRRKHGLPPHPYSFFVNMWRILRSKDQLMVPLVEYRGKVIAGAFVLKSKETFHFEYSASDQRHLQISPNPFLIWETIKVALAAGAKKFDLGRSGLSNPSLIEFKERWGAKRHDLAYYYYPEAKPVNPQSGMGKRLLEMANRYMPKPLLRLEGEILYRHLG